MISHWNNEVQVRNMWNLEIPRPAGLAAFFMAARSPGRVLHGMRGEFWWSVHQFQHHAQHQGATGRHGLSRTYQNDFSKSRGVRNDLETCICKLQPWSWQRNGSIHSIWALKMFTNWQKRFPLYITSLVEVKRASRSFKFGNGNALPVWTGSHILDFLYDPLSATWTARIFVQATKWSCNELWQRRGH